jgi:hypothetical protein
VVVIEMYGKKGKIKTPHPERYGALEVFVHVLLILIPRQR